MITFESLKLNRESDRILVARLLVLLLFDYMDFNYLHPEYDKLFQLVLITTLFFETNRNSSLLDYKSLTKGLNIKIAYRFDLNCKMTSEIILKVLFKKIPSSAFLLTLYGAARRTYRVRMIIDGAKNTATYEHEFLKPLLSEIYKHKIETGGPIDFASTFDFLDDSDATKIEALFNLNTLSPKIEKNDGGRIK